MIDSQRLVGAANQNLVLVTAGKLFVKVEDRYYEINFRDQITKETKKEEVESQEIDLSIYVTNEQLNEILESYDFSQAITTIQGNITNILNSIKDLEDRINELEWNEGAVPDIKKTPQETIDIDQITFEYIAGLNSDTVVECPIYLNENDELVCPSTFIKHSYLLQRQTHKMSTEITSFARWSINNLTGDENVIVDGNKYVYFDDEVELYYLYIVVNSNLSSDNTGSGGYYLTAEKRELNYGGNYNLLAGTLFINEYEEWEFMPANNKGVPTASIFEGKNKVIVLDLEKNIFKLDDQLNFQNNQLEIKKEGIINMNFSTGEISFGTKFYFNGTEVFLEDYIKKEKFEEFKTEMESKISTLESKVAALTSGGS